jgi:ARMET, C-terminal
LTQETHQALLDQRGVTCEGCAEKTELVARVKETYHMPVLPEAEAATKSVPPDAEATKATSKDDVMEMLKNLKRPDGSGFQVFGKDDLEKLRKEMEAKGGPMKNGDHKNADL